MVWSNKRNIDGEQLRLVLQGIDQRRPAITPETAPNFTEHQVTTNPSN
jgi:hypothetical protein